MAANRMASEKALTKLSEEQTEKLHNSTSHIMDQNLDNHLEILSSIISDKDDSVFKMLGEFVWGGISIVAM